jgi:hypothetical protein
MYDFKLYMELSFINKADEKGGFDWVGKVLGCKCPYRD